MNIRWINEGWRELASCFLERFHFIPLSLKSKVRSLQPLSIPTYFLFCLFSSWYTSLFGHIFKLVLSKLLFRWLLVFIRTADFFHL